MNLTDMMNPEHAPPSAIVPLAEGVDAKGSASCSAAAEAPRGRSPGRPAPR